MGARLRLLREHAGQSRETAAAETGVRATTLIRYESDERHLPAPAVVAICRAYDVPTDWLLTGEGRGPKVGA